MRDFTEKAFAANGITIRWEGSGIEEKGYDVATGKMLVCVNPQWFRPTDVDNLWGDPTKAKTVLEKFGNKKVLKLLDYVAGLDGLPKSDVLKFLLEDNCSIVIRPSGTEPKLKMYISVSAEDKETAEKTEEEICRSAEEYLNVPKMDIRNPR